MRHIGIKDKAKPIFMVFIITAFAISLILTIIFWFLTLTHIEISDYYFNGIEVEAEIVDVTDVDIDSSDGTSSTRYWALIYKYVSPEGREYGGLGRRYRKKEQAQSHIGDKIIITINPKSGESTTTRLDYYATHMNDIRTDFPLACIFTGFFGISAYLFFYRVVYRDVLDKKMQKMVDARFINNCVSEGEVLKVFGVIWYYVKVKYFDDKGIAKEKWARAWFTKKEAKFLEQKKYIKIVPYKNTYGILEEMPTEIKQKKSINR